MSGYLVNIAFVFSNWMFKPTSLILQGMEGLEIDGIKLMDDWAVHDGVIPIASSRFPDADADLVKNFEETLINKEKFEKGVWYSAEPIFKMDHFDFCGIQDFPTTMEDFYFSLIKVVNSNF